MKKLTRRHSTLRASKDGPKKDEVEDDGVDKTIKEEESHVDSIKTESAGQNNEVWFRDS